MARAPSITTEGAAAIARPAIVLTRPEASSFELAHDLRRVGAAGPILFAPALRIEPVEPGDLPDGTLVFTSRHGAERAAALGLRGRPALAVGPRTADTARALGFACAIGPGDVAGLERHILDTIVGPILHLHGRHVTGDLADALRRQGRAAASRVVYDQRSQDLSQAARDALGRHDTVLPLYSRRTARIVADQMRESPPRARIAALTSAVADAWPFGQPVHIAKRPDGQAMLALLADLVAAKVER